MNNNNNCLACHITAEVRSLHHTVRRIETTSTHRNRKLLQTPSIRHPHRLSSIPCCNTASSCTSK